MSSSKTNTENNPIQLNESMLLGNNLGGKTMTGEKPTATGTKPDPNPVQLDASKLLGNNLKGKTMTGDKPVGIKPDQPKR